MLDFIYCFNPFSALDPFLGSRTLTRGWLFPYSGRSTLESSGKFKLKKYVNSSPLFTVCPYQINNVEYILKRHYSESVNDVGVFVCRPCEQWLLVFNVRM